MNVDNVDFIIIWNRHSGDAIATAEELGVHVDSVKRRASELRKMDYPICDPLPRNLRQEVEELRREVLNKDN